jgi:hypothetical protein
VIGNGRVGRANQRRSARRTPPGGAEGASVGVVIYVTPKTWILR